MKSSSSFVSSDRRSRRGFTGRIVLIVILAAIVALFWMAWKAGGEKPQSRVEVAVPADKLGK